jgi:predicted nucleic acid-binding protein
MAPARRRALSLVIDTNVILDVILDRAPWANEGALVLDATARGAARGFVASHAVTTVHYLVTRALGRGPANTAVSDLLEILDVVPLESSDFHRAQALGLGDFEDAVQVAACLRADATYLVTRNAKDYRGAPVEILSPGEVLGILGRSAKER